MKKLIYGGLFLAAVGITILACKKQAIDSPIDNAKKVSQSNQAEYVSPIASITKKYLLNQASIEKQVNKKGGKWLRILGADLKGLVEGAGAGAVAGSVIPGVGSVAGAIIGGIGGGIGASLAQAGKESEGFTVNPNGNNGVPNPNNPYDFMGKAHYDGVDSVLSNLITYWDNSGLIYSNYRDLYFGLVKKSYYDYNQFKPYFTSQTYMSIIQESSNSTSSISDFFYLSSPNMSNIDFQIKIILSGYSIALESTVDSDAFVQYSIECENIIKNSILLNEQDKLYILSFMAVARYGISYYNY